MRNSFSTVFGTARRASVALLILLSPGVWLMASAQTPSLSLVSTAWPPFTNAPGQPRFALDLVESALGRIGLTAETTIVSAAEGTPSLLAGKVDGSAAAWRDPERERVLMFSQPYLENRLVLVGRYGADVSAKALGDLKGKRLAIVEGYSYGDAIDSAGPVLVRSSGEEDSLSQLLKGTVEYTLMDPLVVQYIVSHYPKEAGTRLQIGSTPLLRRELYLAVRRTRADAESIITRFNAQLRGMIADRTYHRLLHVDWIRADINGDGVTEYVPADDRLAPSEPVRFYTLFAAPQPASKTPAQSGFYVGGNIYSDWAKVPDSYKTAGSQPPQSTTSLFKFTW